MAVHSDCWLLIPYLYYPWYMATVHKINPQSVGILRVLMCIKKKWVDIVYGMVRGNEAWHQSL